MNNTKTIFKSLLIMIVAISLFTVSCSKDEGGTKTPTTPTIVKVSADQITGVLKGLGQLKGTEGDAGTTMVDFSKMTQPTGGSADIADANNSFAKVKTALKNVTQVQWTGVTVTTDLADKKTKPQTKTALEVNITFKADSGYEFDETITGTSVNAYAYDNALKTAKLTLKITPAQDWVD